MNDLARPVGFHLGLTQNFRIVDQEGRPWVVLKDICKIIGIKNPSDAVKDFPPGYVSIVVCDIDRIYITSNQRGRSSPPHHPVRQACCKGTPEKNF
jgi:hypothetical protein